MLQTPAPDVAHSKSAVPDRCRRRRQQLTGQTPDIDVAIDVCSEARPFVELHDGSCVGCLKARRSNVHKRLEVDPTLGREFDDREVPRTTRGTGGRRLSGSMSIVLTVLAKQNALGERLHPDVHRQRLALQEAKVSLASLACGFHKNHDSCGSAAAQVLSVGLSLSGLFEELLKEFHYLGGSGRADRATLGLEPVARIHRHVAVKSCRFLGD